MPNATTRRDELYGRDNASIREPLARASIQLHVGCLDDLGPALDLLAHIGRGRLRRSADGLGRKLGEALADIALTQRRAHVGIDLADDRRWRLRRRHDGEPGRGFEA